MPELNSDQFPDKFADVAGKADFGTPSARKGGRNPQWPYVPVIKSNVVAPGGGVGKGLEQQIKGLAFATQEEAVAHAEKHIDRQRKILARRLAEPGNRALREQHGLPRELEG